MNKRKDANELNKTTNANVLRVNKAADINALFVFPKLALFGERLRSLILTIGFVVFAQFVVETKGQPCFLQQATFC